MEQRLKIDIGITTILKIIATLVVIYLVFLVREIIALLFITIIIVAALSPLTDYLQKHLKYRAVAVAIVFLGFLIVVAGILYAIIPPVGDPVKTTRRKHARLHKPFNSLLSRSSRLLAIASEFPR